MYGAKNRKNPKTESNFKNRQNLRARFQNRPLTGPPAPSFAETSPWSLAMTVDQMRAIAMADQKAAASPQS